MKNIVIHHFAPNGNLSLSTMINLHQKLLGESFEARKRYVVALLQKEKISFYNSSVLWRGPDDEAEGFLNFDNRKVEIQE